MPTESRVLSPGQRIAIVAAAATAFAVKLLLALKTYGTNDVYSYERFGVWSRYFGADLYTIAPDLNHPPSMLHILRFLLWISARTHLPFHFWIRFPCILADVGSLWLICRILATRLAERSVFIAILVIAIAPIHILISGFHGNTDPVMIFFVVLAVWLVDHRDNALVGGLAFGAALCIKVAPVILLPVLFFSLNGMRKRIAFFTATAALILITWSPFLFQQPAAVFHQVFGYKSSYGLWGFSWLFRQLANHWPATQWINNTFSRFGTPIVMALVLALSIVMNCMERRPSLYTQIGMIFLFFFTATSGFGVQYLAWLTPWIAELGALPVAWFVLTGSVFLLVVYNYWTLGMPWYLAIAYPWAAHQYFQVLCWMSVVVLAVAAWVRISRNRDLSIPALARIRPGLRFAIAGIAVAGFVIYPAITHIRRDTLTATPTYGEDDVLYTQADEYHNLATELARHGRYAEANLVESEATGLNDRADNLYRTALLAQPARAQRRTPEDFVDSSQRDYYNGDFGQCVSDASESLKLRPGMPAAWYNVALCSGEMNDWDGALAAATEAVRLEPENPTVRDTLAWVAAQRQARLR